MTLEEAIVAYLSARPAVAAIVGTRIRPDFLDQGETRPAIRFQVVSRSPEHAHGYSAGSATARVQIDCYGSTKAAAKQLGDQVTLALDGFKGSMGGVAGSIETGHVLLEDARSSHNESFQDFIESLDFQVFYSTTPV